mmetsp:Transcript_45933/g.143745  ORF Transcript_45933/g.143745 Transcript_45933/m.143745 type:complete len:480 (-) Transcript_45933:39-1478(-)
MATQAAYRNANAVRKELEGYFRAAADGEVDPLQEYVEAQVAKDAKVSTDEVLLDTRDGNGRTALHFACNGGGEDVVEFILEECPDAKDAADDDGATPLHLAVTGRQRDAVQMLIDAVADVNRADKTGVAPLHHAASLGSVKMINMLAGAGADVAAQSGTGTALHFAAGNGHFDAVERLLELGAAVDAANGQGVTPVIMAAAKGGNGDIVELLVKRGADTGLILGGGITLLHICADCGQAGAVKAILDTEHGRACANRRTDAGEMPIHMAAASGHEDVVAALFQHSELDTEESISELLRKAAEADGAGSGAAAPAAGDLPAAPQDAAADGGPLEGVDVSAPETPEEAERAMELKNQANRLFVTKSYAEAIDLYTQAIGCDGSQPTFWSNRSACYYAMGDFEEALQDALVAKELDGAWAKAWFRMAQAELALEKYEDAAHHAWEGLKLDNKSAPLKKLLKEAVAKGRKAHQEQVGEGESSR